MVEHEKFGHLHLVYHLAVPLIPIQRHFSQKRVS